MFGPLPVEFADGSTDVVVCSLDECSPEADLLGPPDLDRYKRFKSDDAADAYLRRQSELRRRLGAATDQPPGDLRFAVEPNGKPYLVDHLGAPTGPHFNLSSSARVMALAIDFEQPIGVDVECHCLHPDLIARSLAPALHDRELELLAGDDLDDILQCWVFKEAWIKLTGEGMRADLKGLELWRPGLPERFVHNGAVIRLHKITDASQPNTDVAWVGLARPAR